MSSNTKKTNNNKNDSSGGKNLDTIITSAKRDSNYLVLKKWIIDNPENVSSREITQVLKSIPNDAIKTFFTDYLLNILSEILRNDLNNSNAISRISIICDFETDEEYVEVMEKALDSLSKHNHKKLLQFLLPNIYTYGPCEMRGKLVEVGFHLIQKFPLTSLNNQEIQQIISDVMLKYIKILEKLREDNNSCWHKLWIFLVRLLGKQVHASMELANNLLRVVEFAFRDPHVDQRLKGYFCWQELIDNASLDMNHMSSNKQIKLLIKPLCAKFSKMETVICKRFEIFLYLLEKLQQHSVLCLEEFLHFCFGVSKNSNTSSKNCQGKMVTKIWQRSIEVLLAILGDQNYLYQSIGRHVFEKAVIDENNFEKFHHVILNAVMEGSFLLKSDECKTQNKLHLFNSLWEALFKIVEKTAEKTQAVTFNTLQSLFSKSLKETSIDDFILLGSFSIFKYLLNSNFRFEFFKAWIEFILEFSLEFVCEKEIPDELFHEFCDFVQICCHQYSISEKLLEKLEKLEPDSRNQLRIFGIWNSIGCNLITNPENETKLFVKLFLWPVHHLQKFTGNLVEDVCFTWVKTYVLISENARKKVISELEKTFKTNPLLGSNIVSLISKLTNSDLELNYEFARSILKLMSNILSLPLLPSQCTEKLYDLYLKCTDVEISQKDFLLEKETIENLCNFVEKLPAHLKTTKLSNWLEKIALNKMSTETRSSVENRLNNILSELVPPNVNKTSKSKGSSRSIRVSQMMYDKSKIQTNEDAMSHPLKIFGKNVDSPTSLKVKGSLLHHSPKSNSRSKRIINATRKVEPPTNVDEHSTSDFVAIDSDIKFEKDKLTEHQKEELKRRRDDIPALYQDLSQSQTQSSSSKDVTETQKNEVEKIGNLRSDDNSDVKSSKVNKELLRIQMNIVGYNSFIKNLPPKRKRKSIFNFSPEIEETRKNRKIHQDVNGPKSDIDETIESVVSSNKKYVESPTINDNEKNDSINNSTINRKMKFIKPKKFMEEEKKNKVVKRQSKSLITDRSKIIEITEGSKNDQKEEMRNEKQDPVTNFDPHKRSSTGSKKQQDIVLSIKNQLNLKMSHALKKTSGSGKLIFIRELTNAKNEQDTTNITPVKKMKEIKHTRKSQSPHEGSNKMKSESQILEETLRKEEIKSPKESLIGSPSRITKSKASPSSSELKKSLFQESEDVIESSQEVKCDKNFKYSPKIANLSDALLDGKVPVVVLENKITTSPKLTQADTETFDSKCELPMPVLQIDLPDKPDMTDSQKELSLADTVSIASDQRKDKGDTQSLLSTESLLSPDSKNSENAIGNIRGNLTGSPENYDTPTRNRLFLDSTLDVSPINSQAIDENDDKMTESIDILKQLEEAINEPREETVVEKGYMQNLRSNKLLSMVKLDTPVNNIRRGQGRKSNLPLRDKLLFSETIKNDIAEEETEEKKNEESENLLTFSREVPSPLAVPSSGILKRKLSNSDTGYSPCPKRKRVNFSYPCVSSTKLFVRQKEELPNNNKSQYLAHLFDDVIEDEDKEFDDPFANDEQQFETEESMELTNYQTLCNDKPFYEKLIDCEESLGSLWSQLSSPALSDVLKEQLSLRNINTVGDLAKLSEAEISRLPFRQPQVKTVRKSLDNYFHTVFSRCIEQDGNASKKNKPESVSLKSELQDVLTRIKMKNVSLDEFGEVFLDTTDEKQLVNLLKNVYNTNPIQFVRNNELKNVMEKIMESGETGELFNTISDLAENNETFSNELEKLVQLRIDQYPMNEIIKKRSLKDVELALESCIRDGIFKDEDVQNNIIFPLVKKPENFKIHFNNLSLVQVNDLFVEKVQAIELETFFNKIKEHYGRYTVIEAFKKKDVLEICSKDELQNELIEKQSTVQIVKDLIDKMSDNSEDLIEIQRFLSRLIPINTQIDLHIDLLKNIKKNNDRN